MKILKYFIITVVSALLILFILRLSFFADFDNLISDTNYWEYNVEDNQINNLNDINVSSKSFFNLLRGFPNYVKYCVDTMSKYNIFKSAVEDTTDMYLIGEFLNFMSNVYTLVVYIVAIVLSILQIVIDVIKYTFVIETIEEIKTTISIAGVG